MIVNDLSDEKLAKIFTHYVYRDAEIEDYHSKAICMDETLYAAILRSVSSKLRKIARNHRLLASLKAEECYAILRAMYPTRGKEFMDYAIRISDYVKYEPGIDWDAPVFLKTEPPADKAAYLLDGAFREGCTLHWELDNVAMPRINRDIYNRMYTLVRMGLLPPPSRKKTS